MKRVQKTAFGVAFVVALKVALVVVVVDVIVSVSVSVSASVLVQEHDQDQLLLVLRLHAIQLTKVQRQHSQAAAV